MDVQDLLARLDGVRQCGKDRWIARCPHHRDRHPSLAITVGDRVPILLKCWAGCDVDQIVGALGLELSDLMPDRAPEDRERGRVHQPFTPDQALRCLYTEATFLFVVASDMAAGKPLDRLTKDRVVQAAARIGEARKVCYG